MNHPIVMAITGASGAVYAQRLLQVLLSQGKEVHLTISPSGQQVIQQELKLLVDLQDFRLESLLSDSADLPGVVRYFSYTDFFSPMASGSFLTAGMIVCPCSGGTMSGIVHGASGNLIHRAADVHLKERRKLVLVPRETPLSLVHLENMKRACEVGATVLPAMPGWYHGVERIEDLVDFVVARILDQFGIEHTLMHRWGGDI